VSDWPADAWAAQVGCLLPPAPQTSPGGTRIEEIAMLALNLLGTKEIIVYVVVIVVIIGGWFFMRGRSG
jgi:hypothetical protein